MKLLLFVLGMFIASSSVQAAMYSNAGWCCDSGNKLCCEGSTALAAYPKDRAGYYIIGKDRLKSLNKEKTSSPK